MHKHAIRSLLLGIIAIIAISFALLVVNERQNSRIVAKNAVISARTYNVALDYSGVIVSQTVERGQEVQKGELLATLKSGSLLERLRDSKLQPQDLPYVINDKSEVELRATSDGVVKDVNFAIGSFVPDNQTLFTIIDTKHYYITSEFALSDKQIAALDNNKTIMLGLRDQPAQASRIIDVTIDSKSDKRKIIVESVPFNRLQDSSIKVGEPVKTTLILKKSDKLERMTQWYHTRLAQVKERFGKQ